MTQHSKYGSLYNALSGLELRKKILHEVEVLLDGDDRFRNHVTYPRVSFEFKISLEVYPGNAETFSLRTGKQYGDPETMGAPRQIVVESQVPHQNPDRIRAELELPVPRPQATQEGIVDLTKAQADEQNTSIASVEREPMVPARTAEPALASEMNSRIPPASTEHYQPANPAVVVGGHGGNTRIERTEIPGHAVMRPLIIPREPANGRMSIANEAAEDGAFGKPLQIEIGPRGGSGNE